MSHLFHWRITASFILMLLFLLGIVFFLISIALIGLAFRKLGFPPQYSVLLLFLSLIGSYINIPVMEKTSREPVRSGRIVDFYGFRYVIPPIEVEHRTIIAVNIGGGIIPVFVFFFLTPSETPPEAVMGFFFMIFFKHGTTRRERGRGRP